MYICVCVRWLVLASAALVGKCDGRIYSCNRKASYVACGRCADTPCRGMDGSLMCFGVAAGCVCKGPVGRPTLSTRRTWHSC